MSELQTNSGPTGWIQDPDSVIRVMAALPHPMFSLSGKPLEDTGKGKTVLLYQAVRKVVGHDLCHKQTIGDCVSHGWSLGVDVLKCVQIFTMQRQEAFGGETATEVTYAGSRVEEGRGQFGRGDGSVGAMAAKFVSEYGTLVRAKYGSIDLTEYSGARARSWGMPGKGVPDELETIIKQHPVRTVAMVTSYEEARDAIANGYPVPVCSNQGFTSRRDSEGFAKPYGHWGHCMLFMALDDAYKRPGLLCMNSWGTDWIGGPKRLDQPDGSFWVDADAANSMLRAQDSFAISSFVGIRPFPVNPAVINHDFLASA